MMNTFVVHHNPSNGRVQPTSIRAQSRNKNWKLLKLQQLGEKRRERFEIDRADRSLALNELREAHLRQRQIPFVREGEYAAINNDRRIVPALSCRIGVECQVLVCLRLELIRKK